MTIVGYGKPSCWSIWEPSFRRPAIGSVMRTPFTLSTNGSVWMSSGKAHTSPPPAVDTISPAGVTAARDPPASTFGEVRESE